MIDGRDWLAIAIACCAFSSCGDDGRPTGRPPDVVLVTLDTTRFDHTSTGGAPRERTPRLAELADTGINFTRAYAPVPVTLPSHATILSGRLPPAHGLTQNGTRKAPADLTLLAERFKAKGYATAAFVSATVLDPRYGLARGFDVYVAPPAGRAERQGSDSAADAAAFVRGVDAKQPAFVWLHLYDAHAPYAPPRDVAAPTPYAGEIAAADRALGVLLDAMSAAGRLDHAIVCVTADHGEGLGDHGEDEHGMFLYEEAIHVPLVLRLPRDAAKHRAGVTDDRVASLADIAPTLAGLCALEPMATDGADLIDGEPREFAYAETYVPQEAHGFAPLFARVESRWKYVDAPQAELYDLAGDPREARNVLADAKDEAIRMHTALAAFRAEAVGGRPTRPLEEIRLAPDEHRVLEELGYLGSTNAKQSGLDPKVGIHLHNMLREASKRLATGDSAGALDLVRRVTAADAGNRAAAHLGAKALVARGESDAAQRLLDDHLRIDADDFEAWLDLGVMRGANDANAAAACFERATQLNAASFEAWFNLGLAREKTGNGNAAVKAYERALPTDADGRAHNALAWLLATTRPTSEGERARTLANVAVRKAPANADFHDTLAEAHAACGDFASAIAAEREAVRLTGGRRAEFGERLKQFERRKGSQ